MVDAQDGLMIILGVDVDVGLPCRWWVGLWDSDDRDARRQRDVCSKERMTAS